MYDKVIFNNELKKCYASRYQIRKIIKTSCPLRFLPGSATVVSIVHMAYYL